MKACLILFVYTMGIIAFVTINMEPEKIVYACSDPDIPPEVAKRCPKKTPRMEDGCIVREVQGREFKVCG